MSFTAARKFTMPISTRHDRSNNNSCITCLRRSNAPPRPHFTYAEVAGSTSSWRRHSHTVQLVCRLDNFTVNLRHITPVPTFGRHQADLILIYIHILIFFYVVDRRGKQVKANRIIRFAPPSLLRLPCVTNISLNNSHIVCQVIINGPLAVSHFRSKGIHNSPKVIPDTFIRLRTQFVLLFRFTLKSPQ